MVFYRVAPSMSGACVFNGIEIRHVNRSGHALPVGFDVIPIVIIVEVVQVTLSLRWRGLRRRWCGLVLLILLILCRLILLILLMLWGHFRHRRPLLMLRLMRVTLILRSRCSSRTRGNIGGCFRSMVS